MKYIGKDNEVSLADFKEFDDKAEIKISLYGGTWDELKFEEREAIEDWLQKLAQERLAIPVSEVEFLYERKYEDYSEVSFLVYKLS